MENDNFIEENNSNNKTRNIIIIAVIVLLLLVGCFFVFKDKILKTNEDNTTIENNTTKENIPDVDENTNITEDNNITIDENKTSQNEMNEPEPEQMTFDYCTKYFKKLFSKGDYTVYENPKVTEEFVDTEDGGILYNKYYVVNTKTKDIFDTLPFKIDSEDEGYSNNYYLFLPYEDDENVKDNTKGMFNIKNKQLISGYNDYSCQFHSDVSSYLCDNNETTMVSNYTENESTFGLISLKDFSIILKAEYSSMYEIGNYFLVSKNNKSGIYDKKGNKVLDVTYDYLGYSEYLGYIGIKGNDIEYYNTKLEKQDLSNTSLKDLYKTAYEKSKGEIEYLFLATADSYFWTVGTSMRIQNMNEPFDKSDSNYRYKYTGSKYSGEHLVINSLCSENYIYVIEDNKAYKINKDEIYAPEDEDGSFCF